MSARGGKMSSLVENLGGIVLLVELVDVLQEANLVLSLLHGRDAGLQSTGISGLRKRSKTCEAEGEMPI